MEQFDERSASHRGPAGAAGYNGGGVPGDAARQAPVQGVTAEEQYLAQQQYAAQQAAYEQQQYAAQQQYASHEQQPQQHDFQGQQAAQPAPASYGSAQEAGRASAPAQAPFAQDAPVGFLADLQQTQRANEQLSYSNSEQTFVPNPEQVTAIEQQFAQTEAEYAARMSQQEQFAQPGQHYDPQAAQAAEAARQAELERAAYAAQLQAQQEAEYHHQAQADPAAGQGQAGQVQQAAQQFAQQPAFAQGQQYPTGQPTLAERFPQPRQTRVFAISNQKGGVGKTTSAVNLAVALAQAGARVLVIDLDPQGNASTALGVDHRSEVTSVYDVIVNDVPLADAVQASSEAENLFCVPATIHLAGAEIELVSLVAREQRLRAALARFLNDSSTGFHYVFIDCPPSLGLLTINAFVAANEVLIPIQCEYYALEGLSQLLTNIELIQKHLNPQLRLTTILLTMFDSRTKLAAQVAEEVRQHFPRETLNTIIPRSVRVSEAPSYGQTVITYDNGSIGSLSYLEAASEIAQRGVQG